MRRFCFAVAIVVMWLGCAGGAFSQQQCHDLRALNTQSLGTNGWLLVPGATRGIFDGQLLSPYYIEYQPGQAGYPNLVAGRYWDFSQVWTFHDKEGKTTGTFTVSNYHASFPVPTGKAGMGMYNGSGKITGGTGIFSGATGTVMESGPYIIWFEDDGTVYGQYNATYVVRVCIG